MSQNLNKDLQDHAWDEMNKILDEHMPQKKRGMWNPWMIFGAILLSTSTYWAYSALQEDVDTQNSPSKVIKDQAPMASLYRDVYKDINTSLGSSKNTTTKTNTKTLSERPNSTHLTISDNTEIVHAITHASNISLTNEKDIVSTNSTELLTDIDIINTHSPILLKGKNKSGELIKSNDLWIVNSKGMASLNISSKSLNNLPTLSTQIIYNDKIIALDPQLLNPSNVNISPMKHSSKWGIVAGLFSDNLGSRNGGHVGFIRSTTFSNHFEFSYGLSFDMMSKKGFKDVISSSDRGDLITSIVSANGFSNSLNNIEHNTTYDEIAKSVDQLYYSHLPISVNYWFLPKFRINTGINISYLIYGTNGSSIRNKDNNYDKIGSKAFFNQRILNKFDLGVEGGFSYKITPRLISSLSYRYGASQILRNSQYYNRVDFNRSFDFSLEYML